MKRGLLSVSTWWLQIAVNVIAEMWAGTFAPRFKHQTLFCLARASSISKVCFPEECELIFRFFVETIVQR